MKVATTIAGADVTLMKRSLKLDSRLGDRVSTAEFNILGEDASHDIPIEYAVFGEYFIVDGVVVEPYPMIPFFRAVEGYALQMRPSLALADVIAIGGFIRPWNLDEVKIDRKLTPMLNCAIADVVAMGGHCTFLDHFFGGYLVSVERTRTGPADKRVIYNLKAQDYNRLPLKIVITESYVAQTEAQIITDLFATYLPEVDSSTYVESSGVVITIDWTRKLLSEALDELAKIYGKEWYIDHEKYFHYFTPATATAPFALSDLSGLCTAMPYDNIKHLEDTFGIINRITVVGDPAGPIVVTRTDAGSYAQYGRYFDGKYVDDAIDTVAWANSVGDAILAELAFEKGSGKLTCFHEGLVVGQKVRIINEFRNIDGYYLVQAVRLSMIANEQEQVDVEYGAYEPKLVDLLMRIAKTERRE